MGAPQLSVETLGRYWHECEHHRWVCILISDCFVTSSSYIITVSFNFASVILREYLPCGVVIRIKVMAKSHD
jgi:hypothetical protein